MSYADYLGAFFSRRVLDRGERYFQRGRVAIARLDEHEARAGVYGANSARFEVTLSFEDARTPVVHAHCQCPSFASGALCEHVWAALLEIEQASGWPTLDARLDDVVIEHEDEWFDAHTGINVEIEPAPERKLQHDSLRASNWRRVVTAPRAPAPLAADGAGELRFIVNEVRSAHRGVLVIEFHQRQRLSSGGLGQLRRREIDVVELREWPDARERAHLQALVSNLPLAALSASSASDSQVLSGVQLDPARYAEVLAPLADSGRLCRRGGGDVSGEVPLGYAGAVAWRADIAFETVEAEGVWRATATLRRGDEARPIGDARLCLASGIVLIDDVLGPLDDAASAAFCAALVDAGGAARECVVPFAERDAFLRQWWASGEPPPVQLPEALRLDELMAAPVGELSLPAPERRGNGAGRAASVRFDYDGLRVRPREPARALVDERRGAVVRRDPAAEARQLEALRALGAVEQGGGESSDAPSYRISERNVPELVTGLLARGWRVLADGQRLRGAPVFDFALRSGIDWFELRGEARFGDETVALPAVLRAVRTGENFVPLADGSRGLLPEQWRQRFATLAELGSAARKSDSGGKSERGDRQENRDPIESGVNEPPGAGDSMRFEHSQALLLDVLLDATDARIEADAPFERWRERLAAFGGAEPADPPAGFEGDLRTYQREGLGWMLALRALGLGGCLADDMGLGKTVQVLALLAHHHRPDEATCPSLIVVPKSLVHNWVGEAARFAPRLRVGVYAGLDRKARVGELDAHDIVVTTYGTVRRDAASLSAREFGYVVLDEAHAIKNARSQTAKACRVLRAAHRLALTGTPVGNRLDDLWSLFEFLNPGMLGRASRFETLTRAVADDERDATAALAAAVRPYLLRRTKEQVLPELPEKFEQTLTCELPPAQRKLYDDLRAHYRAALTGRIREAGLGGTRMMVLEALLRLRQAACHPALVDASHAGAPSAKLDLLVERLAELAAEGHKALVFSQFTQFLAIVRERLEVTGMDYAYLDGRTHDREAPVARFQSDAACTVFLISLKAGGHGLNLTAADYVFVLDPWWNPAVEAQAIDRAHRMGQTRSVFAYRLVAADTVEEKIVELKAAKRELADAIITADGDPLARLGEDDLDLLLG